MEKKKKTLNEFYDGVVAANEGITRKNVKSLFVWYDLLSCMLSFQLIFILIYKLDSSKYAFTMLCAVFTLAMDAILKNALERDGKNYVKFNKHKSLVKLWAIPLILMAIGTIFGLIGVTFGLFI